MCRFCWFRVYNAPLSYEGFSKSELWFTSVFLDLHNIVLLLHLVNAGNISGQTQLHSLFVCVCTPSQMNNCIFNIRVQLLYLTSKTGGNDIRLKLFVTSHGSGAVRVCIDPRVS